MDHGATGSPAARRHVPTGFPLTLAAAVLALGACGGTAPGSSDGNALNAAARTKVTIPRAPTTAVATAATATSNAKGPFAGLDEASVPAPAARTPTAAVRATLDAQIRGDVDTVFGSLAASNRRQYGSPSGLADMLIDQPTPTAYRVVSDRISKGEASVVTELRMQPSLDEVSGLVPAEATATWRVVAEDGGWRVDLERRSIEPAYADQSGLLNDTRAWAESRQSCASTPTNEYGGGLLHIIGLASELCGKKGAVTLDESVQYLDELPDPSPVLNAFGGDAAEWARVVTVTAPVPQKVVVAPVGDRWVTTAIFHDR